MNNGGVGNDRASRRKMSKKKKKEGEKLRVTKKKSALICIFNKLTHNPKAQGVLIIFQRVCGDPENRK